MRIRSRRLRGSDPGCKLASEIRELLWKGNCRYLVAHVSEDEERRVRNVPKWFSVLVKLFSCWLRVGNTLLIFTPNARSALVLSAETIQTQYLANQISMIEDKARLRSRIHESLILSSSSAANPTFVADNDFMIMARHIHRRELSKIVFF